MFNNTGTSAQPSGSLFGTASGSNKGNSGGSIFGNTSSTPSFSFGKPNTPAFGGGNDKKEDGNKPSNIFGSGSNTFGQATSTSAGNTSTPTTTAGSTSQPSLFGAVPSTGSLFGAASSSSGTGGNTMFGNAGQSKSAGGLFGNQASSTQTPGTPGQSNVTKSIFGSTTPASAAASNFFGGPSTTPAGQPPSTNLFGASTGGASSQSQTQTGTQASSASSQPQTTTSSAKPSLFGAAGTSNLFGPKPSDNSSQATPAFGGFTLGQQSDKSTDLAKKPDPPSFSFPTTSTAPASSSQASNSFFTANKPSDNSSATPATETTTSKAPAFNFQTTSSSNSENQPAASKPPAFTGFNLGATSSEKPSLFGQGATASTQPTEQAKPAGPMFPSLGATQTTTSTSSAATPTAPAASTLFSGFGTNKQTPATTSSVPATNAPTSSNLFKLGAPTASTQSSEAAAAPPAVPANPTVGASNQGASGISTFGASTTGPVPPAQSRLRNRTMDEILTRWAADLTRYTKEFKGHAEQIAYWDQIIVDNSAKIDKLYVKTRTCEKQTMSVEMQLSAVENQQNELEAWLSKYEGDVEEMLSKDGSGQGEPGGPDQERERTYQLAEKLGERLDDMDRDLQSMIEEVNAANAGLGKTSKVDEPVTQIVKILNSHLSQLQAIDQGTAALQARVTAAQKAASGMNYLNRSMNGDNRGAADDFYRSYMRRR